jgi:hypothetical protein
MYSVSGNCLEVKGIEGDFLFLLVVLKAGLELGASYILWCCSAEDSFPQLVPGEVFVL